MLFQVIGTVVSVVVVTASIVDHLCAWRRGHLQTWEVSLLMGVVFLALFGGLVQMAISLGTF